MSTALEQEAHEHGLELHVRVARARACALMLILSDALSIVAILAAGGYLSALNTESQFKVAGDHAPAFVPSLVVAILLVVSGLAYYWWERMIRQNGGTLGTSQKVFFILSCVVMIAAMAVQLGLSVTLNLGYTPPYDAYESVITLLTWYTAFHLLLTAIIGLLLLGRGLRGRLAGHEYLVMATGYWWYYTVVVSLIMWLFTTFIT